MTLAPAVVCHHAFDDEAVAVVSNRKVVDRLGLADDDVAHATREEAVRESHATQILARQTFRGSRGCALVRRLCLVPERNLRHRPRGNRAPIGDALAVIRVSALAMDRRDLQTAGERELAQAGNKVRRDRRDVSPPMVAGPRARDGTIGIEIACEQRELLGSGQAERLPRQSLLARTLAKTHLNGGGPCRLRGAREPEMASGVYLPALSPAVVWQEVSGELRVPVRMWLLAGADREAQRVPAPLCLSVADPAVAKERTGQAGPVDAPAHGVGVVPVSTDDDVADGEFGRIAPSDAALVDHQDGVLPGALQPS
jgi:hypothetical protein